MSTTRTTRSRLLALGLAGATALSLSACSKAGPAGPFADAKATTASSDAVAGAGTTASGRSGTVVDADTAALVPAMAAADPGAAGKAGRTGDARDRLIRALHATWVTMSKQGPVTHQAIRGEVTAVTATSVTVKAKDGYSLTFAANSATMVKQRDLSAPKGQRKPVDSSLSKVSVGDHALVVGTGATGPTATRVVFLTGQRPAKTAQPSAPSSPSAPSVSPSTGASSSTS